MVRKKRYQAMDGVCPCNKFWMVMDDFSYTNKCPKTGKRLMEQ